MQLLSCIFSLEFISKLKEERTVELGLKCGVFPLVPLLFFKVTHFKSFKQWSVNQLKLQAEASLCSCTLLIELPVMDGMVIVKGKGRCVLIFFSFFLTWHMNSHSGLTNNCWV